MIKVFGKETNHGYRTKIDFSFSVSPGTAAGYNQLKYGLETLLTSK